MEHIDTATTEIPKVMVEEAKYKRKETNKKGQITIKTFYVVPIEFVLFKRNNPKYKKRHEDKNAVVSDVQANEIVVCFSKTNNCSLNIAFCSNIKTFHWASNLLMYLSSIVIRRFLALAALSVSR